MLCGAILLSLAVRGQKIDDFERIPVDGFYTNPLFSPNGEFVLLTGEHLRGVYVLDLKDTSVRQISDKEGSGYAYTWDESGNSFYYKEKPERGFFTDSKVIRYDIRDNLLQKMEHLDHNFLPSYKGGDKGSQQVVIYTNTATLKIEARDLASSRRWEITKNDGQFYNAILSNDGQKVAVHNGPDIYIYSIDGSFEGKRIGTGIATAWTADDKYLLGFLDESDDGHIVTNSELYLFDTEKPRRVKLTSTEVISEMFPTLHGDKVIFTDDKSGRIFIATLKL